MFCGKRNINFRQAWKAQRRSKMALKVSQLRRMEKLESSIHDLCEKNVRSPNHYLEILQAVNDGLQIDIIKPTLFLSLAEQLKGFAAYNQWLKKEYPEYAIPDEELAAQQAELNKRGSSRLIFYCHNGDVVLTARLAWEYTCSYRETISDLIEFKADYMRPAEREPDRPTGFYTMKLSPEDKNAIGKKFQGRSVSEVRSKLGNDWAMGSEGLQFVGITHRDYLGLMDGRTFPWIDLPALIVSRGARGDILSLDVFEGKPRLIDRGINQRDPHVGSGSLQQC